MNETLINTHQSPPALIDGSNEAMPAGAHTGEADVGTLKGHTEMLKEGGNQQQLQGTAQIQQSTGTTDSMFAEQLFASPISAMVVPTVLWVLICFSVVSWALLLIKGVQFGRFKVLNRRFTIQFWESRDLLEGSSSADINDGALAYLARCGMQVLSGADTTSQRRELASQINRSERLERTLNRGIQTRRRTLENGLAVLASIGSTAPFIGLFGTVWGIMEALVKIGMTGQADLGSVAGPIGHALIATGVGIAAAVPAVLIYNFFVRKLKLAISDMELFATEFYSVAQEYGFMLENVTPKVNK